MSIDFQDLLKPIDINQIEGILLGNAEDREGGTGLTVILAPQGMCAGVDVRGGGPASRETELLDPRADAQLIHAVVLSGGSAYGLRAADGVMTSLRDRGLGFETGYAKVPLVVQSCLYDLGVADSTAYPDASLAKKACEAAFSGEAFTLGNYGAGTGATVGKLLGMEHAMKSGLGAYALQLGELQVGAIVAVNALGDVYDPDSQERLAGIRLTEDDPISSEQLLYLSQIKGGLDVWDRTNTTIGCILTNAKLTKAQLGKVASMAQNGYARTIRPVHSTADGDTIYAVSTEKIESDVNIVGTLAARVMAQAVRSAVLSAEDAYGFQACTSK